MKPIITAVILAAAALAARGATFSTNPSADAFVTTGPTGNLADNNYGGAGSVSVAAPGLPGGEAQSVLQFDLGGAFSSFNGTFGVGQWSVQSVTLQLNAAPANNAIFNSPAAGLLGISWMQNDGWTEGGGSPSAPGAGGITFRSLQSTFSSASDEALGSFSFSGATSGAFTYLLGLTPGFSSDVVAGDTVSLRLSAADSSLSGVFNSRSFGTAANRPVLSIVAVPEASTLALAGSGLAMLAAWRWARLRK